LRNFVSKGCNSNSMTLDQVTEQVIDRDLRLFCAFCESFTSITLVSREEKASANFDVSNKIVFASLTQPSRQQYG